MRRGGFCVFTHLPLAPDALQFFWLALDILRRSNAAINLVIHVVAGASKIKTRSN